MLHGRIPFVARTLAQLQLDILNSGRMTANAGIGIQPSAKGMLTFGTPRVDGSLVPRAFARWIGTGGVGGARGAARLRADHRPDRHLPARPADRRHAAAACSQRRASSRQAGPHGIIPLQIEGEQIAARIVGTVDRFPSVDGDAVVADRQTAATILDTRSPGLGTTDELWLNVPAARRGCDRRDARARAVHPAAVAVAGETLAGSTPTRSPAARC